MPTIRDVAKLAGVSISTVSIVLNGKSEERKVAKETAVKVLDAIKTLDYKPSLAARRLRSAEENKPVIALYWPLDYRTVFLARVLMGLQGEIKRRNFDCDVVVCTYENDKLYQEDGLTNKNRYSSAIVGAASANDMEYLKNFKPEIPIILYNRYLENFNTVCSNDEASAYKAASIFAQKGHKRVAVISAEGSPMATSFRTRVFMNACKELNIEIKDSLIVKTENSYSGGAQAAKKLLSLESIPRAIFCDSDLQAVGATFILNKENIRIPEDIEIIAYGLMSTDITEYTTPPITVVSIPSEEMAAECIVLIEDILNNNATEVVHKIIEPKIFIRDSCRI